MQAKEYLIITFDNKHILSNFCFVKWNFFRYGHHCELKILKARASIFMNIWSPPFQKSLLFIRKTFVFLLLSYLLQQFWKIYYQNILCVQKAFPFYLVVYNSTSNCRQTYTYQFFCYLRCSSNLPGGNKLLLYFWY